MSGEALNVERGANEYARLALSLGECCAIGLGE